jgi:hypothetical protein
MMPAVLPPNTLALSQQRTLVVERRPGLDLLRVFNADGQACLTVRLTPTGPVLQFDGSVVLQTSGALALDAEHIALHGRDGVTITSGGDVTLQTAGDLTSRARVQNIRADLGNVNLQANDDVRLNGERVLVNCVDV